MRAQRAIVRFLAAMLLLPLLAVASWSYDEVKLKDAERLATLLQAQLRGVVSRVNNGTLQDEALAAQRVTLEKIRASAGVGAENAAGPLSEIASQVNGLGPTPADGLQEAESIATQRKDLNAQLARATAAQKQFVLVGLEAEQALARLASLQRSQFLQRIFKADKSVLNPALWNSTLDSAGTLWARISDMAKQGFAEAGDKVNYSGLLLLPLGMLAFAALFLKLLPRLFDRFSSWRETDPQFAPTGLEKLWHVIWSFLTYVVLLFVFIVLLSASLDAAGLLTGPVRNLQSWFLDAIVPALTYGGLVYFVAAPRKPAYRLLAVDNAAARSLVLIIFLGYVAYGFGDQVSAIASSLNLPVSFTVGQTALSAITLIILIIAGLVIVRRESLKGIAGQGTPYFLTWFLSFMPLWWALVGVAIVALLFGFVALSYFIAGNIFDTAILAMAMGVLHAFTDALALATQDPHSKSGHALRRITHWSEPGIQRLVLVLRTIADATLIVVSLLAIIALWTVVLFDVAGFVGSFGQGFKVGNITLSPKAILIALIVLVIGITATKYFTRWLDQRVLSETHLDKGVQNSLRAVAGYTGYSLAAAFGLSAAGLEFSNFALVAGALGVGIGFGLQSIVNNFVSGLILLAERPVRVGDWVVTNAGEGIVKKINVRSTEIETFDNCTIIVPNANLISEAVRNWTHRDSVGRFFVAVSLVHGADAQANAKILQGIVQNHPKVMRHPPPTVQLSKISPQGLEFDIRGHIRDVFEAAEVASDIRLEISRLIAKNDLASSLPPAKNETKAVAKRK